KSSANARRRPKAGAGCRNCAPKPISISVCRGINPSVIETPYRLALTPGEPAGIGPDLAVRIAQTARPCELVAIADPQLLAARAKRLGLPLRLLAVDYAQPAAAQPAGTLRYDTIARATTTVPGQVDPANAGYVLDTLTRAVERCRAGRCAALVTGPVHKEIGRAHV